MKKDGEDSSYLPKGLDHAKALSGSAPHFPSRLQLFRLRLLKKWQESNQDYQKVDSAYQNAFKSASTENMEVYSDYCLPSKGFKQVYHEVPVSTVPIKVLCNTSGFCFWAYPAWSSPAYWRQLVAVHNAQRHRIQSSFPRMLQSPAVF